MKLAVEHTANRIAFFTFIVSVAILILSALAYCDQRSADQLPDITDLQIIPDSNPALGMTVQVIKCRTYYASKQPALEIRANFTVVAAKPLALSFIGAVVKEPNVSGSASAAAPSSVMNRPKVYHGPQYPYQHYSTDIYPEFGPSLNFPKGNTAIFLVAQLPFRINTFREDGDFSPKAIGQIEWTFRLRPGEEKVVTTADYEVSVVSWSFTNPDTACWDASRSS